MNFKSTQKLKFKTTYPSTNVKFYWYLDFIDVTLEEKVLYVGETETPEIEVEFPKEGGEYFAGVRVKDENGAISDIVWSQNSFEWGVDLEAPKEITIEQI